MLRLLVEQGGHADAEARAVPAQGERRVALAVIDINCCGCAANRPLDYFGWEVDDILLHGGLAQTLLQHLQHWRRIDAHAGTRKHCQAVLMDALNLLAVQQAQMGSCSGSDSHGKPSANYLLCHAHNGRHFFKACSSASMSWLVL